MDVCLLLFMMALMSLQRAKTSHHRSLQQLNASEPPGLPN